MDDIIVPELQNVDTTLIIDPDTRTIDAGSDFLLGVETDNDAERVKFQCPKIVGDNLDLSQYHIYIHYQNAKGEKGKYLCEDIEDGGENITFSWLLSQKAVLYKGQTKFLVCAKKTQEETIVWNTTLASGNVLEGLDVDEEIVQQNDDVIEQILLKLEQIEASGGTGDINNAKVTFTEAEERTNIKSQETMSTMFGKIKKWFTDLKTVAFSGNYEDLTNKPTIPTKTSQLDNDSQFSTFSGSYNDLSDKPTIPNEYTLPIATPTTLGGVKPIAKTDEMTQEVGVDELGGLFTKEGGGSSNKITYSKVFDFTSEEEVMELQIPLSNDTVSQLNKSDKIIIEIMLKVDGSTNTSNELGKLNVYFWRTWGIYSFPQVSNAIPTTGMSYASPVYVKLILDKNIGPNGVHSYSVYRSVKNVTINDAKIESSLNGGELSNGDKLRLVGTINIPSGTNVKVYVTNEREVV